MRTRWAARVAELALGSHEQMSAENTPMTDGPPTPAFRLEEGVLICSCPGQVQRHIPIADVSSWLGELRNATPVFKLHLKAGGTIELQDPEGELPRVLSTLGSSFVSLDALLNPSTLYHVDERLRRYVYSDGSWRLSAKIDMPFQADAILAFEVATDKLQFPEAMAQNVLWIQDNLGEIWNAAARMVNSLAESQSVAVPERFALRHLWAHLPDAALDTAEWRFTLEVEEMYGSFEVVFLGLEPISCKLALPSWLVDAERQPQSIPTALPRRGRVSALDPRAIPDTFKEYRLTPQEASGYNAEGVVERVVWRLMEDEPSIGDSDAMEEFFGRMLSVQAAVYAAWHSVNWIVVGGIGHVFETCSVPMIEKAIEGYELLHEPHLADCVRRMCKRFPGGTVPRDCDEAWEFLSSEAMDEDAEMNWLQGEFSRRPVEKWFDVERFYHDYRDGFVIPQSDSAQPSMPPD